MSTPIGRPGANTLRWNSTMKWIRRLHLYAGLLLFPWIILYGITACLFNHPDWFSDRAASQPLQLDGLPSAKVLAQELIHQINQASPMNDSKLKLVRSDEVYYSRKLAAQASLQNGQTLSLLVDLETGQAEIRNKGVKPAQEAPSFAKEKMQLASKPMDKVNEQLRLQLAKQGYAVDDLQLTVMPELELEAEKDSELWDLKYQLQRGVIIARKSDAPSSLTTRNFLLRLHLAHGYPNEQNIRWFWAIVVDAMFVAMVFWGLSGLFMWWQLKAQRRIGFVLLLISAGLAVWLTWGMHAAFSK
jgi:hypothetical protein